MFTSDFCHPMLAGAKAKVARFWLRSTLVEAAALALPLPDASMDLIRIEFGFRNFANYRAGLAEMRRVLPIPGGVISGAPEAYQYLPESVRKFPDAPELAAMMGETGFGPVEWEYLTFGIVALHVGRVR